MVNYDISLLFDWQFPWSRWSLLLSSNIDNEAVALVKLHKFYTVNIDLYDLEW